MLSTRPALDFEPFEPDHARRLRLTLIELRDRRRRALEHTRERLVELAGLVEALKLELETGPPSQVVRAGRDRPGSVRNLSTREVTVLKYVAFGLSNKEVAYRLGISEKTVRNHLTGIFVKLAVSNRTEAVLRAVRSGVLSV